MIFQRRTTRIGFKSIRRGTILLDKEDKTAEEMAAAGAFRRIAIGILVLLAGMVVSLCAVLACFDPVLSGGSKSYGTVVEDGQVRYERGTDQYAAFGKLGLEGYALDVGEQVILFFDNKTGEFEAAYPQTWYEQYTETRVGIIIGTAMLWITLFLLYAVICRITPFGQAWHQYCRRRTQETEAKLWELPPGSGAAAYIFIVVMTLITCWPQVTGLMNHFHEMREIETFGEILQDGQKDGENATGLIENLQNEN